MRSVLIRAAIRDDAPAIARVHVASRRAAYAGLLPESELAPDVERRADMWGRLLGDPAYGRTKFLLVAVAEGEVVGFAAGGPERAGDPEHTGEIRSIYLLPSVQRRGIGAALARELLAALCGAGLRSALAWVLASNPACAFYEALGAVRVGRKTEERAGASLELAAYGWKDLLAGAGPRERAVWDLWTAFARRDWAAARALLHDRFGAAWPNTGETFDREAFLRVNEVYPGDWRIRVVRVAPLASVRPAEVASVVEVVNGLERVFATSFFSFGESDRIAALTEYWSECAAPPEWRRNP